MKFNSKVGVDALNETSAFRVCLIQEPLRFIGIHLKLVLTCSPKSRGGSNSNWMETRSERAIGSEYVTLSNEAKRQARLHNCKFQRSPLQNPDKGQSLFKDEPDLDLAPKVNKQLPSSWSSDPKHIRWRSKAHDLEAHVLGS